MMEWISVKDRLPEEGTIVLIYVPAWGDALYTGYFNGDDGWHHPCIVHQIAGGKPTGW